MNATTEPPSDKYEAEVINPGDAASKLAKDICFQSHNNSPFVHIVPLQPDNFRGAVGYLWRKDVQEKINNFRHRDGKIEWQMMQTVENDGAGGKPQFFTFMGEEKIFENLGWEIITMTRDDFSRTGRKAVIIDNEVNVKQITPQNFHLFKAMMTGYGKALKACELVNITGETAIMKHSVTAFCDTNDPEQLVLTWGASCIGLCERDKLIDGSKIEPGMLVIGLFEDGYRCNGGTFLTNTVLDTWGTDIPKLLKNPDAREFVRKLTVPSRSYGNLIDDLVGWNDVVLPGREKPDIRGIAHITGGGIWGKFKEILPPGVGAGLDSMPAPPPVLLEAQKLAEGKPHQLSDWAGYGTLHGGCGMLIVCSEKSGAAILSHARHHRIGADVVGRTTASDVNEVLISSRFSRGEVESSEHKR